MKLSEMTGNELFAMHHSVLRGKSMNLVSYGGGTNSTALLIECMKRDIHVDLILFADTGAERPHTYAYVEMFSKWLVEHGMPEIITVKTVDMHGEEFSIIDHCVKNHSLPSIAYGFKSCSEKHKIRPQNKFCNHWQPFKDEWKSGRKVVKMIGFDFDEDHRIKEYLDKKYTTRYPLVEWEMGRDECIQSIKDAGLCLPGKSACFICPSTRPPEIKQLAANYPELAEIALMIERTATPGMVKGLGRNFAWADLLATDDMFADDFASTPEMTCGCYDG